MDEIKKVHSQIEKENEELIKKATIGNFLLKNHEDIFSNMDKYAEDMASNTFKRFMMLNGESDGLDKIIQITSISIYNDKEFIEFINKICEYFLKIQTHEKYEKSEQFEMIEKLIYDKFRLINEKLSESDKSDKSDKTE